MTFGERLTAARKAVGLSQQQLADAIGVTQGAISHWATGRKLTIDADTLAKLETVLHLSGGSLAAHLPDDHPAKKLAVVKVPLVGIVDAGCGRDEPFDPNEYMLVSSEWMGCVAYEVRGDSMTDQHICSGDRLIVVPVKDREPEVGDVVVAWIRAGADEGGHVVKTLANGGVLRSFGKGEFRHKLREGDEIRGVLVDLKRSYRK
jgi:repressor LexA